MKNNPVTSAGGTSALVSRREAVVMAAAQVDEAVLSELTDTFSKWARIQLYGQGAIAIAATALFVWGPLSAAALTALGVIPALILGNYFTDRATVEEFVAIGLSPELARRLLKKTYTVPSTYFLLPFVFSNSPRSKRRISKSLTEALAKC